MKLNPDILEAVRKAVDFYGNTSQFAKKIGVAHSTVLFWLNGKTTNISGTVWDNRLRKELSRFMPKQERSVKTTGVQETGKPFGSPDEEWKKPQKSAPRKIPVIPFSLLSEMDITIQSPVSFVRKFSIGEVPFANPVCDFSFALLLDRSEYCPPLPLNSRILINGIDYADDGDIVVTKTRNPAKLIFCRYFRRNGTIRLEPLNPALPMQEWNAEDNAERLFWIFPVKEISIDLESFRWRGNALISKTKQDE